MSLLIILAIGAGVVYSMYKITNYLDNKYPEDDSFTDEIKNALYGDNFTEKYIKTKYGIIKKAAEDGDADAQLHIGRMLEKGVYLEKNISKAQYWYNLSANQGNAWALINLACIAGDENESDKEVELNEKALKNGEIGAAYNLGCIYRYRAGKAYKKGNISVEEFLLNRSIQFMREGLIITKPLYNSSYKDFLKYRYEIAIKIQKSMGRVDMLNKSKEHEEEAKRCASIAEQCDRKMRELYNIDIRNMPEWDA